MPWKRGEKKDMTYRILSPCAILGYGIDETSFREAAQLKLDLIAADAGSMDPGPYYLGQGVSYMKKPNLKRDFSLMLKAALQQACPLLLGSCGMAGDTPHLRFMLNIAREVFAEQGVRDLKVAVIDSHVENDWLRGHLQELRPLGEMPALSEKMIRESRIVGQMGLAPFITALNEGAQIIFAGRACDVAIFAADPIRRGMDPGLAFHAGHILECGAIACDPGSGSDGLIAEFRDDGSVVFIPPNQNRQATTYSIAAHSLYEEDHPSLQYYPEGVLSLQETQYFQDRERSAGIRKSLFGNRPISIKLEGSRKVGERVVSILPCQTIGAIPEKYLVYGRNGVEDRHLEGPEKEMGLLLRVASTSAEAAHGLLALLKMYFMHYGYPGRRATAGNLAFPLSPSEISFRDDGGKYVAAVIAGTRDPFFQESYRKIEEDVISLAKRDFGDLYGQCDLEITVADGDRPVMFLETVGPTKEAAVGQHSEELRKLEKFMDPPRAAIRQVYAGEAYQWSLFHLLTDEKVIREKLFPISLYQCQGQDWRFLKEVRPRYRPVGRPNYRSKLAESQVDIITRIEGRSKPKGFKRLRDMAKVIRSKNAGVNRLTYDIFFNTPGDYQLALSSNAFVKENIAQTLKIPPERIINTYRADACLAIKISAYRASLSGSPGERDVFGAQQHMNLMSMRVPF